MRESNGHRTAAESNERYGRLLRILAVEDVPGPFEVAAVGNEASLPGQLEQYAAPGAIDLNAAARRQAQGNTR